MAQKKVFPAVEGYTDLLEGSECVAGINPLHCVPYSKVRPIVTSGILRLKMEFLGVSEGSSGFIAGGSQPYLVILEGDELVDVVDFLIQHRRFSRSAAEEETRRVKVWYGIVDGVHRIFALVELASEYIEWKHFSFTAVVIRRDVKTSLLKAFARALNRRHMPHFTVADCFVDRVVGLRQEADEILRETGKAPSNRKVAERYLNDSNSKSLNTTTQEAQFARNLSKGVVEALVQIVGYEDPDIVNAAKNSTERALQARHKGHVFQVEAPVDPRLHLNLFKMYTLRHKSFLEAQERVQVATLWRAKYIHEENSSKLVRRQDIEQLVLCSKAAVLEAEKLERVNGRVWPEALNVVCHNLLRTTILDLEVQSNKGNDGELLPSIVTCLRKHCPSTYANVMRRIGSVQEDIVTETVQPNENAKDNVEDEQTGEAVTDNLAPIDNDPARARDEPNMEVENSPCSAAKDLEKLNCHVLHMRWQDFQASSTLFGNLVQGKVDLLITDPPRSSPPLCGTDTTGLTHAEMIEFAAHCKRCVKDTGNIHLICPWYQLRDWVDVLHKSGLSTMQHPMHYIVAGAQRHRISGHHQNIVEYGVTAFKSAKEHYFDSTSSYKVIQPSHTRHFNVFDNIPAHESRLTYASNESIYGGKRVCTGELSPAMLNEVLTTYSPPGGLVYDPFAGTFTVCIAALRSNRKTVAIECDERRFNAALARLLRIGESYLKESKGNSTWISGTGRTKRRKLLSDTTLRELSSSDSEGDSKNGTDSTNSPGSSLESNDGVDCDSPRGGVKRKVVRRNARVPHTNERCDVERHGVEEAAINICSTQDKRVGGSNDCGAEKCRLPLTPLGPYPTICSGLLENGNRCEVRLHDLCDYAKQNQTALQEEQGTFDQIGFCSKQCFFSSSLSRP